MDTVVQIDLDAIEQAALSAPLKGPFWAVTDSYDTTIFSKVERDTGGMKASGVEGVMASGTESYVDYDMLPFFTAASPAVVLALVALARRGAEALQAEDRVTFNLSEAKEEQVLVPRSLLEASLLLPRSNVDLKAQVRVCEQLGALLDHDFKAQVRVREQLGALLEGASAGTKEGQPT